MVGPAAYRMPLSFRPWGDDVPTSGPLAITVSAVLLLCACSAAPERANQSDAQAGVSTNIAFAAPSSDPTGVAGGGDGAMIADGRIPAAFLGRWGLTAGDCTSTGGDNKGLMTIEPDRLTFYESRATIARLTARSPTELHATLAFTGEGQEWTQETPLILENDGAALTRVADGQTLRYARCGA